MSKLMLLSKDQIKPASIIISKAFFRDPLMIYLFPESNGREQKLAYMMELLIRIGMNYGIVHVTSPKLEGIAIWFPSNNVKITPWMGILNGGISYFFKLGKKLVKRQNRIYNYINSKHRALFSSQHWYLSVIAIDPLFQGRGFSHILLNSMFIQIDKQNLATFLDTNNKENIPIYKKHGFKILEKYEIPNTKLINWAMIRDKK
ncbi:MAG: GNAT family N-acetyltransferase [Candidatus Hermodarchaeota archaeon]